MLRRRSLEQYPAFEKWLTQLQTDYANDILPLNNSICDKWGRMMAERTLPFIDGLLAATAHTHNPTVATRNVADYKNSGVKIVNPFNG